MNLELMNRIFGCRTPKSEQVPYDPLEPTAPHSKYDNERNSAKSLKLSYMQLFQHSGTRITLRLF